MAETTYTYSVALDTLNGLVSSVQLIKEIQGSSIVIAIDRVDVTGDILDIVFKDALDSADVGGLDTLVADHDGVVLNPPDVVKIQETTTSETLLTLQGIRFVADLSIVTDFDLQFTEVRELQNVNCFVANHTDGDYIEFTVHMPDSSDALLKQFAVTVYVPPGGEIVTSPAFETSVILAGLILRFSYTSVATSGPQPIIICHLRTHI